MTRLLIIFFLTSPALFAEVNDYNLALQAFKNRDYVTCYEKITKARSEHLDNPEYHFFLGRCAFETSQLEIARDAFKRSFELNPELLRSRLEYAVTLFRLEEFDDSKKEFEILLDQTLPSVVQEKVELFVRMIDGRPRAHEVSGAVILGIKYDTNILNSIDSDTIEIPALGFSIPVNAKKEDDRSHYEVVTLTYTYQPENYTSAIKTETVLYNQSWQKHFERSIVFGGLKTGWYKRTARWRAYLPLLFQKYWLSSVNYLQAVGVSPEIDYVLNNTTRLHAGLHYRRENYLEEGNDNLDVNKYGVEFKITKLIQKTHVTRSQLELQRGVRINGDRTDVNFNSLSLRLGHDWLVDPKFKISLDYEYEQKWYKEEDVLLLTKRKDDISSYRLGLAYELGKSQLLDGSANYTYHLSNHQPFNYDKALYSLEYIHFFTN